MAEGAVAVFGAEESPGRGSRRTALFLLVGELRII